MVCDVILCVICLIVRIAVLTMLHKLHKGRSRATVYLGLWTFHVNAELFVQYNGHLIYAAKHRYDVISYCCLFTAVAELKTRAIYGDERFEKSGPSVELTNHAKKLDD